MRRVLNTPRTVLGRPFDPTTETYGEMVNQVFGALARESISLARIALDRGSSLVIAPQGVFTSRLTKGRIGGVQFAAALGLPMIPVGVSGMLEAYPNQGLRSIGGTVHLRFGAPVDISLPTDHIPFDKACEVRFAAQLESETQRVMEAINGLLEPAYQWDDNPEGDGIQGVARFMD